MHTTFRLKVGPAPAAMPLNVGKEPTKMLVTLTTQLTLAKVLWNINPNITSKFSGLMGYH